jgi:biotin carboxyl carrier protein
VILESMKTEIPVPAPHDGVVRELHVAEGASIREGDVIAVLD